MSALVSQALEALGDHHGMDGTPNCACVLKLALLITKPQPRSLSGLQSMPASYRNTSVKRPVNRIEFVNRPSQGFVGPNIKLDLGLRNCRAPSNCQSEANQRATHGVWLRDPTINPTQHR